MLLASFPWKGIFVLTCRYTEGVRDFLLFSLAGKCFYLYSILAFNLLPSLSFFASTLVSLLGKVRKPRVSSYHDPSLSPCFVE